MSHELQVSLASEDPAIVVEVILKGCPYSPDVATDIKRRAVDAFREGVAVLMDFLGYDTDEPEKVVIEVEKDK